MWVIVVLNALGIAGGVFLNKTVMYVLFGISFTAFFHKYAVITWHLIYEKESYLVNADGKANMVIANELVCAMYLAGIYILIAMKAGFLCVVLSAAQSIAFQAWRLAKQGDGQLPALIALVAEFSVIFLVP